ncbi:ABC transporter substrate-binding protein [Bradyrhizobium genosp. SA-3]|uniref:ABC transporter substrate-binding protein n=1 Tax=Bradyrhizobium genosp. SA-3 TaxID=508868 RepID=UPI0013EE8EF2|nr:ABC transporter substrate-binding protein [Bradyrhizobium genosp. SA-3]
MLTLVLMAGIGTADAEPGITEKEIVLGNILPMSSSAALAGRALQIGTQLAATEANAAGGVAGRSVVLKTEDDGYVPARAVQGLRKLIDEGVFGLLSISGGGGSVAMLPIVEEQGIPAFASLSPLKAAVDPVRPTVFMIGASYQQLIYSQLKYVKDSRKRPDAIYGVIRQDDDFGDDVEKGFQRAVDELKIKAVAPVRYKRGQKEFGAEILKLRSEGINVLVAGGVTIETAAMLREASKFKMDLDIATVPTMQLLPVMKLSEATEYAPLSADYVSPLGSPEAAHFESLVRRHLREDEAAAVNRYSIAGYVVARVMIEALRRCEKELTRTCVTAKLTSGEPFDVDHLTQPISFTKERHTAATAVRVLEVDPKAKTVKALTEFAEY